MFKSNLNFLRSITIIVKIHRILRLDKVETYEQYLHDKIGPEILSKYLPENKQQPLEPEILQEEKERKTNQLLNTVNNDEGTNRKMLSSRGLVYSINDSEMIIERRHTRRKNTGRTRIF